MGTPAFVHLNVHSAYSLGAGATRLEELAARAGAYGYPAIALTDTNAAYGLPPFQVCCDAAEVRALHGAEIEDRPDAPTGSARHPSRAVLLVENATGYRHLCGLITARQLDPRFTLVDDLPPSADGLIVLTPCPALLRELADVLPADRLFAECIADRPVRAKRALLDAAKATARPLAGTHRVFFDHPDRHALHRLMLAMRHLKFLREIRPGATGRDGRPLDVRPKASALMSPAEAVEAFADIPEAAVNTLAIAERLTFRLERPARPRLPVLELEGAGAPLDPEQGFSRLATLCIEGVRRRYGRIRSDVLSRLERELRVIQMRGFADYFLIVHGLTTFAREHDIPAVGRGSAANSIVAYALGITSVDPLRYDLPFERFLSPVRKDCPDIDLDIDWRGRDAVIQHAYDTYGEDRVAMISTHITWQARSAVREIAKTFGLSKTEVDRVAEHLPWRIRSVLDGRQLPPELDAGPLQQQPWRGILRAAVQLDGMPRHLSIHVGGIVIGDGPLAASIPLERSAKGLVVTQYDMHGVEATGLVKIDLLGNRALAVIADVLRDTGTADTSSGTAMGGANDAAVGLDPVPEDDPHAADLLRTGRTFGCFQVESPGMRNLVVRMDAHTQDDAMIALSLIRPGPAGSGMKDAYIRRRRGEETTPSIHPLVDPLFQNTFGVMLYQEDTLRVAAAVAGFDLAQADTLRRALSKKREPEDLPAMEQAFRDGAKERGVTSDVVEHVWQSIARFSAYAYNKAHAATYSRISWQGLYLKARHPAEFLASVLRNGAGFYAPRAYVEEARRLGCRIELPCVNRSEVGPEGRLGVLRLGLDQVKGLRRGTPDALVRNRLAQGPYLSPTDLILRTDLEKHEVERLVLAGALDVFDRPRGELLWLLTLDFDRFLRARQETRERTTLFGPTAALPPARHIPVPPTYTARQLLEMEVEALGLTATCHPAELWKDAAENAGAIPTVALKEHVDELVKIAGWIVTDRRVRISQNERPKASAGRYMKFLMLEDLHGTTEVTLFPRAYARVGHRLTDAGPYLVTGLVRNDYGSLTLDGRDVRRLEVPE
ncbi:MAG: DNA polymerase III subunit alpha [Planctomycetota bacterium]|nr:DNA polymerase III subunit alpha [Planctomycetota bacterium]